MALIGCEETEGGAPAGGSGSGTGAAVAQAPAKNPGGGFSADLAKRLDSGKTGSADAKAATGSGSAEMKGSADAVGSAGSGSAEMKPAETKPAETKPAVPDTKTSEAKPAETKPAETKPAETKPVETKPAETKPAETKVAVGSAKPPETKQGSGASTAPKIDGNVVISTTAPKGPVSAELKSINISLLPNWERDVEGAGTFSLAVKVPNKQETTTFVFRYGIEDASAPADRDQYKKWLADKKIFISKDDRQKGGAWYLEGVDGTGKAAFRMVVTYGGKKLICFGSLYKDSSLGDLRDQTIIQAKQICETVAL